MTHKDSFENLWDQVWKESEKEFKEIGGVAVVIEVKKNIDDLKSKVAFIVENETKAWKNPGQLSVPFGTIEKGESPLNTGVREMQEELGITLDESLFKEKGEFVMNVNTEKGKIKVNIHVFHILLSEEPNFKIVNKKEISDILLVDNSELNKVDDDKVRPGTRESLFIANTESKGVSILVEKGLYKSSNVNL